MTASLRSQVPLPCPHGLSSISATVALKASHLAIQLYLQHFMSATLDRLIASARRRVAEAKRSADRPALEWAAEQHQPRGFRRALHEASATRPAIIAELKKASPSKGTIRGTFHVAALASELAANGANALSVLTEEEHFQGSLDNLCEASAATDIPCLRKDFIIDEFQVVEARANRADAILLIAAALSQGDLVFLNDRARDWGLDVLCEVHDAEELTRAIDVGFDLIGVNSRNLRTFEVDLNAALSLASQIPDTALRVAESGIHNAADLRSLRSAGYQAFLIGESLMRADNPGEALKTLLESAKAEAR
jgi:indole-3-glycerol phosphate synthase